MPNSIILATQRSGSTLLCAELEDIGGLGHPGEHFLDAVREGAALSQAEIVEVLERGRDGDGNVGLKLMADYLPTFARVIGESPDIVTAHPASACARALRQITDFLGPTRFFRIDREDRLDQTLSRYLAVSSGIYFRTAEGQSVRRGTDVETRAYAEILTGFDVGDLEGHLGDLEMEVGFLDAVLDILRRDVLGLSYEALAGARSATLRRCCLHAGRRPPAAFSTPWMRKVVDDEMRARFRRRALDAWAQRRTEGRPIPAIAGALLDAEVGALPQAARPRVQAKVR